MRASGQAGSLLAAFFFRGREMQAKADLAGLAEDLGAELRRPIQEAQARRDWRAAAQEGPEVRAGQPLRFEGLAAVVRDREGAARRRQG